MEATSENTGNNGSVTTLMVVPAQVDITAGELSGKLILKI
jgi:hypothetical protein